MGNMPPGYRFYPTEEELILFYLHNKLEGEREDMNRVIPVVDIYDYNPSQLPRKNLTYILYSPHLPLSLFIFLIFFSFQSKSSLTWKLWYKLIYCIYIEAKHILDNLRLHTFLLIFLNDCNTVNAVDILLFCDQDWRKGYTVLLASWRLLIELILIDI